MKPRERVALTLKRKIADRIPIDFGGLESGISYETYILLKRKLTGSSDIGILDLIQGLAIVDEIILRKFNVDTRYVFLRSDKYLSDKLIENNYFIDDFGIKWPNYFWDDWGIKWNRPSNSHYYDVFDHRLKGSALKDIDNYIFPEEEIFKKIEGLKEQALYLYDKTDYAVFIVLPGLFELSWQIYGMVNFFEGIITNTKFIERLLDKVLDLIARFYGEILLNIGSSLDCLLLTSDLGSQTGPLISPKFFKEIIKPREIELINFLKEKTNAKFALHSCGSVYDFLPDIIDIGYEVLNPVQATAFKMSPLELKKEFGKYLVLWGGIDTQHVLPFGKVEDVKKEVIKKIDELGSDGGYIFAPCHNIQANTPVDNIIEMFNTVIKYGYYHN